MEGTRRPDVAEIRFFELLQQLVLRVESPHPPSPRMIAAVDCSYRGDRVVAVATLFREGALEEVSHYSGFSSFPYVSGIFYVREGPFAVAAIDRLSLRPELVCFDAHGAAHPSGAGMATTVGRMLGIPSIGVAKSVMAPMATKIREDGVQVIQNTKNGEVVGLATVSGGKTLYWSPGFSVSLGDLESLIRKYGQICLRGLAESHERSRMEMRNIWKS